tara:strand:+ start:10151 stop:11944 length:1794 start_codon:yes stop_codon:yes gene_type:complete
MTQINKPIINYTARDFRSIKEELITYAQKYYPETYRDFNEASFGSLMTDMVAYVGDMLSFYADYQANESYLSTAIETESIIKLTRQMGYRFKPNASSIGRASFFVSIPAQANSTAPDMNYAPVLKRGSVFGTTDNRIFTLVDDVDFSTSVDVVVASSDADGTAPTHFAVKAQGLVLSGELMSKSFALEAYERFRRVVIDDPNVTEIINVFDADGNNYYEVEYLTQDTVYVPVLNTQENVATVTNILKPIAVPRRFVVEQDFDQTTIQFGFGTENNEERRLDPASVALDIFAKSYITDKSFDPTVLIKTDKLGVSPSNTLLTVVYRRNSAKDVNAGVGALSVPVQPIIEFHSPQALLGATQTAVETSIEVINEEPIHGDVAGMSSDEMKERAYGTYGAQNRAVTRDDYIHMIYNMPSTFGQIKKATITRDTDSFNGKNLNIYVMSTDTGGSYIPTNNTIKQNLKTWISKYKMLGDTVDILNAHVINLEIYFTAVSYESVNKYDALTSAITALQNFYADNYYDIGEPFKITDVYKLLNNLPTILDVKDVIVQPTTGASYSDFFIPFEELISPDGRYLVPPSNVVFEIKFPVNDIDGEII